MEFADSTSALMSVATFEPSIDASTVTFVSSLETVNARPGTMPEKVFELDVTLYFVSGFVPIVICASTPCVRTSTLVKPLRPSIVNSPAAPLVLFVTCSR